MVSSRHTQHTDIHTHMYVYKTMFTAIVLHQLVYFLLLVGPPAIAMSSFLFLLNTQDKTQFHVFRNYRYHYTTSLWIEVIFTISMTKKKNSLKNISHHFPTSFVLSKWFLHFVIFFPLSFISLKMSTVFRIDWIHLTLQYRWCASVNWGHQWVLAAKPLDWHLAMVPHEGYVRLLPDLGYS